MGYANHQLSQEVLEIWRVACLQGRKKNIFPSLRYVTETVYPKHSTFDLDDHGVPGSRTFKILFKKKKSHGTGNKVLGERYKAVTSD